ncbi:ABC-F family ATP-binding cassette domain-containing protein [Leucobacter sp. GX24907]
MRAHHSTQLSPSPSLRAASRAAAHSTVDGPSASTSGDHLTVTGISASFGDRRVLSDISFTARDGDRIGLIGENGTGKSTLLSILSGRISPDAGEIHVTGTVGLLAQELPYADGTLLGRVLDDAQRGALSALADIELAANALADRPEAPGALRDYETALEVAERSGAWSAESRRGDIVSGLGLGGVAETRPIGELSGGQRLRLALASVLLEAPRVLLLDEPSNHLDDAAAAYLEQVLREWPGIVIVASHDRTLLDAITTRILDLDPLPVAAAELADAASAGTELADAVPAATEPAASEPAAGTSGSRGAPQSTDDTGSGLGVRVWGVGYSAARAARRDELERWRKRYEAETEERSALIHEIDIGSREVNKKHESKSEAKITRKFYADKDARVTARRARNARVRLEQLERERVRRPPEPLRFAGIHGGMEPAPGTNRTSDEAVLTARAVRVGGRLAETSLEVAPADRLLLAGPNGAGKSTLLAVLAGRLAPDAGMVDRARPVALLPQEVTFSHPERSTEATYLAAVGSDTAEQLPLASLGLIAHRDLSRPVGSLSVGQRRRVALAALLADPPPILLLDEPTNHLSLTLVEELEEALRHYAGALIIATHDRWLRSRWEGRTLHLEPFQEFD